MGPPPPIRIGVSVIFARRSMTGVCALHATTRRAADSWRSLCDRESLNATGKARPTSVRIHRRGLSADIHHQAPERSLQMHTDNSPRLKLAANLTGTEHVDGTWWPRSPRLTEALPELVTELSDRVGNALIVGYHRSAWPQTPAQLQLNGQTIELVGFDGEQPASIIVIGTDGRHISLSIIAPDTDPQRAYELLEESARKASEALASPRPPAARNLTEVAQKLVEHEGGDPQRTAEITQWVDEAAQQFNEAPIQTFVPILVEHVVRNRIFATRQSRIFPLVDMSAVESESND